MTGEPLELRPTPYDDPVVRELEAQVQQEYTRLYGSPDADATDPTHFLPPDGVFLVGWLGTEPVVTGALRRHDETTGEVKRMYVVDACRGRGFGRAVLAELERRAALVPYRRLVLETGAMQPEAIELYRSSGYEPVTGFGHYRDSPLSRSFSKSLRPPPPD